MAFADSKGGEEQPYKYNDKELDSKLGLNPYDYAARYINPGWVGLRVYDGGMLNTVTITAKGTKPKHHY